MERVMLTLPPDLLEEVDKEARRLGRKRSHLVREVLEEWLERQRQQEFEALLVEGYQSMAERAAAMSAESLPLQAAAAEAIWHWDE